MIDKRKLNVSFCYHCEKEFNQEEIIITMGISFHTIKTPPHEHRYIGIQVGEMTNPTARFHEQCFELIAGNKYSFDVLITDEPAKELYVGSTIPRPKP